MTILSRCISKRWFNICTFIKVLRHTGTFVNSFSTSNNSMNVFTQKNNPITGTMEWDVQNEDYDFHQEIARSAFADMLHDTERNKKYYSALKLAIDRMHEAGKKAHVLDIGTGTGLLSIMAAQCGADSIVACEAFQPMAECAVKILKRNNVAQKITVIPKRSTELTIGEDGDMKVRANILVTEVFDTELIGEGALSTFSHAHKVLLDEDCIVVPDSAVIYVQVVECPTLQKWNKLNDLADEDLEIILKTPQKMKDCAGSAAVHDIQLSQLPRHSFRELSEPIPVFYYDWSGRTPLDKNRVVRQQFTSSDVGKAQMVFMWWELNMDPEGKISLSCAPWWCHPDAKTTTQYPQDTIPWRDHWMQAVYYFPQETTVQKDSDITLVSCQDEYSLWFYLENEKVRYKSYKRPICECGVHMMFSRTHVAYLNDGRRSKKFLASLRNEIDDKSVVLALNGGSLLGLAAAKMGAQTVYNVESNKIVLDVLNEYTKANDLPNVQFVPELSDDILSTVSHVVCDPNFTNSVLPWDNLKMAYLIFKSREKLRDSVKVIPQACSLWALPVEFLDLHKIRIPLGDCEGVDMSIFDELIEGSREISDQELEAQPLWEYPCVCRGEPQNIFSLQFQDLKPTYAFEGKHPILPADATAESCQVNGFVVWADWDLGGSVVSGGPLSSPCCGQRVNWDPHTRQAVRILSKSYKVGKTDSWSYAVACNLSKGSFDVKIHLNKE